MKLIGSYEDQSEATKRSGSSQKAQYIFNTNFTQCFPTTTFVNIVFNDRMNVQYILLIMY